jgi:SAM-dependent methyltransferase
MSAAAPADRRSRSYSKQNVGLQAWTSKRQASNMLGGRPSRAASRKWSHSETVDCNERLPFRDAAFDVIVCIDAVLHLKDRFAALANWSRLLRPKGRLIFTDAAVVTGPISIEELYVRASQGTFLLVPPGVNEHVITASGLVLCRCDDRTQATAAIAEKWHDARECL